VRLTRSDGLASPIALGRSEICVPGAVLTDLDAAQQRSVLAHELAHIARRDPLWLTGASLLERVFFFQPLNRLARRRIQESAEYLCDDWAVGRTGSGITMAKSLMKVAEWMHAEPSPVPWVPVTVKGGAGALRGFLIRGSANAPIYIGVRLQGDGFEIDDMTFDGAVAALKSHLAKRGFGDIEVNPSGGYDPTDTALDAPLIQAQLAVLERAGIEAAVMPRIAGSYPGYAFTGEPLRLAAGHFGLGHGSGAHAPDEYFVIEPSNPMVSDWDGAVASHAAYLFALAD